MFFLIVFILFSFVHWTITGCLCAEDQPLNLMSSQAFPVPFPGHAGHPLIFLKHAVVVECPRFQCLAPEIGKSKQGRGKSDGTCPSNPLKTLQLVGEGVCHIRGEAQPMAAFLLAPLGMKAADSEECIHPWYFRTEGFCPLWLLQTTLDHSRNRCTAAGHQLRVGRVGLLLLCSEP